MLNTEQYYRDIFTYEDENKLDYQLTTSLIQFVLSILSFFISLAFLISLFVLKDESERTISLVIYVFFLLLSITLLSMWVFKNPLKKHSINNALFIYLNVLTKKTQTNKLGWANKRKISLLVIWINQSLNKVKTHIENQFIYVTNQSKVTMIVEIRKALWIVRDLIHSNQNNELTENFITLLKRHSSFIIFDKLNITPKSDQESSKINYEELESIVKEINSIKVEKSLLRKALTFFKSKSTLVILLILAGFSLLFVTHFFEDSIEIINTITVIGFIFTIGTVILKKQE